MDRLSHEVATGQRRRDVREKLQGWREGKPDPRHVHLAKLAIVSDTPTITCNQGGLMSVRPGILSGSLAMSLMIGASFLATPSQAYTDDQQQLCTGDAFRLCSAAIPDVDRVTACMIQKRAQLSPGCAQFFRATPVSARKPTVKSRRAKKPTRPS
ncbi:hypothetical protein [Tardiphaga sp. OK246]|nr:hypothetical protein [Tardiphaga sp. OK246]